MCVFIVFEQGAFLCMNQKPEAIKIDKYFFSLKICKHKEKHFKKAKDKQQPRRQYLQHTHGGHVAGLLNVQKAPTVTHKAWRPDR